jgi:glycosyltransferase involved in cell wall biosynthesis
MIDRQHALGIAVYMDMDDDLFSDDFVRRLIHTHDKDPQAAEQIRQSGIDSLRLMDGVTVSNQRLATLVRKHTDKPVEVVANYMDIRWFQSVLDRSDRQVKGLCIGWAGGKRPDSDVEQMAIAWQRIMNKYPDVTFFIQGHQPPAITERIPDARRKAADWLPVHAYPLPYVNIDIGCCPLQDTYFNRCKTHIKAMEYSCAGAAVVASPTVYNRIIEHGVDGYLCETADEWETALAALIDSPNRRKRTAQRLMAKVQSEHSLEGNVWRWPVAWENIYADFRDRQKRRIVLPTGYHRQAAVV